MSIKTIIKNTAIPATLMFLAGCAQQGRPGGGEGDIVPPRYVSSKPVSQSINVPVDRKIVVEFNEWIEPASAKKAVTVHPTLPGGFKLNVDTRRIEIVPNESFAKNTTYHISINSELTDYYRNKLKEPVNCVFSTGNSIDSGMMKGGVVSENDQDKSPLKAALFFGERLDTTLDTTLLGEPDYLTQCDSLDRFTFENINENSYSLIAFRDKNSDNRLTPGETVYFPKSNRVGTGTITEIQLFKANSDTTRWKISKVIQAAPSILQATVTPSRMPDSAMIITADSSVNKRTIKLKPTRILSDSSTILFTADSPVPSGQYDLISWWPNRFTAGKSLRKNDSIPYTPIVADTVRFNAVPASDSAKTKFLGWKFIGENSRSPRLKLSWSNPVNFTASLELTDSTGGRFPLVLVGSPEKELGFRCKSDLPAGKNLFMTLHSELFTTLARTTVTMTDSVVKLKTVDDKDIALSLLLNYPNYKQFGSWLWEINAVGKNGSIAIPLRSVNDGVMAEEIPAGSYTVSLFEDRNGNGIQDRGMLFPRINGEPRIFLPDTVKAKARWRTELALETTCSLLKNPAPKKVDSLNVPETAPEKK